MAYAGLPPATFSNNLTNVQLIDDISSSFNGSTQTFALTTNSSPFHAVSARSLIVVLGGIVQKPQVDYTVDGTNITFTIAPVSGLTFAARNIYGLNYLNNVNDGVLTPAKLSTGGPTWTSAGNLTVSGDLNVVGSFNSGTQGLFWQDNEPANFGNDNDLKIYHNATDNYFDSRTVGQKVFFRTSSSTSLDINALTILSNGNTGIGTTSPTTKLDVFVNGGEGLPTIVTGERMRIISNDLNSRTAYLNIIAGTSAYSGLLFGDASSAEPGKIRYYHADNSLQFFTNGANNERVRIDSSGNVGIGTTNPVNKLHIFQGNLELTGGYNLSWGGDFSGGFPTIWGNGTDKTIRFAPNGQTNGLNALLGYSVSYILNGNIGIGTTNPQQKLEIYAGQLALTDAGTASKYIGFYQNGTTLSGFVEKSGLNFTISNETAGTMQFANAGATRFKIDSSGHVLPHIDATYNLGSSTNRWANIYSADLQLSNEGSQNDVDGTWGQYTIQEGENDLFLLNRRNGKKYKFVLQEVG